MRDVHDRVPGPLPETEQLLLHELSGLGVERREGLVHEQHRRIDRQRAGDPDSLAHAARELMRVLGLEAVEPDEPNVGLGGLSAACPIPAAPGQPLRGAWR
jgi:hypothetical protein